MTLIESRFFGRICYGYTRDEDGFIFVDEEKAKVIKMIFRFSLEGMILEKFR